MELTNLFNCNGDSCLSVIMKNETFNKELIEFLIKKGNASLTTKLNESHFSGLEWLCIRVFDFEESEKLEFLNLFANTIPEQEKKNHFCSRCRNFWNEDKNGLFLS